MNIDKLRLGLAFELGWKVPHRPIVREYKGYTLAMGDTYDFLTLMNHRQTVRTVPEDVKAILFKDIEDEARGKIAAMDAWLDDIFEKELVGAVADIIDGKQIPKANTRRRRGRKNEVPWNHKRYDVFVHAMTAQFGQLDWEIRKKYG